MALTIIPSTTEYYPKPLKYTSDSFEVEVYHTGIAPTATPSDSWITCTWKTYTDNGSKFTITVSANDGSTNRNGSVLFEHFQGDSGTFYVHQVYNDPSPAFAVDPSVLYWNPAGGLNTIRVYSVNSHYMLSSQFINFEWTPSWISNVSFSSQGGEEEFFFNTTAQSFVQDPPTDIYRMDTVAITDSVSQKEVVLDAVQGAILPMSDSIEVNSEQNNESLYVYFGGSVAVSGNTDWMNCSLRTSGNTMNIYNVAISANPSTSQRTAYINLEDDYSEVSVPVIQDGVDPSTVTMIPSTFEFYYQGGSDTTTIAGSVPWSSSFSYPQGGPSGWLTLASTSTSDLYEITAARNSATTTRSGDLVVSYSGGSISGHIVQYGRPTVLNVAPSTSYSFSQSGEQIGLVINTSPDATAPTVSASSWMTATSASVSNYIPYKVINDWTNVTITPNKPDKVVVTKYDTYYRTECTVVDSGEYRATVTIPASDIITGHKYLCAAIVKPLTASDTSRMNAGYGMTYPYPYSGKLGIVSGVSSHKNLSGGSLQVVASIFEGKSSSTDAKVAPCTMAYNSSAGTVTWDTYAIYLIDLTALNLDQSITTAQGGIDYFGLTPMYYGPAFYTYDVQATPNTGSDRTGSIIVNNSDGQKTITVSQAGAVARTVTVDPSELYFSKESGSSLSFTVDNDGDTYGISLSPSSASSWLSYSMVSSSNNVDTYEVTTAVNGGSRRSCDIIATGTTSSDALTVYQTGSNATLSASPSSIAYTTSGGVEGLTVTWNSGTTPLWRTEYKTGASGWLTQTTASQPGQYEIYGEFLAASNSGTARTADIVVFNGVDVIRVPVSQAGYVAPSLAVSPSSLSFAARGGERKELTVSNISGNLTNTKSDWITLALSSSSGNSIVYGVYASNNSGYARNGYITFNDDNNVSASVAVSQAGTYGPLSADPNPMIIPRAGTRTEVAITYTGGLFQDNDAPDWITSVENAIEGSPRSFYVTASVNNTGYARMWNMHFYDDNDDMYLPVIQYASTAPSIQVSPTSGSVSGNPGSVSIQMTSAGINPQDIHMVISDSWLTYASDSGNTYTFDYSRNNSGAQRSATITFYGMGETATYTLTQAEIAPITTVTVSPSSFTFESDDTPSNKKIVTIVHPVGTVTPTITYNQGSGWLDVDDLYTFVDDNTSQYYVYVTSINSGAQRTATVTWTASNGGATGSYTVTQKAGATPPPASGDFVPVWRDMLYTPTGYVNGQDYTYRLIDGNQHILYEGISAAPDANSTPEPINISRIVESYINSGDFNYNYGSWYEMAGTLRVNFYEIYSGSPIYRTYFMYWNDWSRYNMEYSTIRTLNDPINGHSNKTMKLPLCVYQKGNTNWNVTETKVNGTSATTSLGHPNANSYNFGLYLYSPDSTTNRIDFKRGSTTEFSYDRTYCGQGYFIYRNRFGGWDSFLIEGNIYKREDYDKQRYSSPVSTAYGYSVDKHTDRVNITTSYEVHTGWLTDDEAERLVYHLLSSPKVYFTSFEGDHYELGDMKEVNLTGSQAEYKKYRNGRKLTSYAITFEAADTKRVQR